MLQSLLVQVGESPLALTGCRLTGWRVLEGKYGIASSTQPNARWGRRALVLARLHSLASIALRLVGELIAPTSCAACEALVAPRVLFCPACVTTLDLLPASSNRSLARFEYGGAIATAITRLKYGDRPDLGPRLGQAMLPVAQSLRGAVDIVIPVPLHPRRLQERGYNQAVLLAAPVAQSLALPLLPRALLRIRDTTQQATLDRSHRLTNLGSAFRVRARDRARIEGKRILLVDDVRTTGATLEASAIALREKGARDVLELVLARKV